MGTVESAEDRGFALREPIVLRQCALERYARTAKYECQRTIGNGFNSHLVFPLGKLIDVIYGHRMCLFYL